MFPVLLPLVALGLAYANGTNDNFKGVATLYGSGRLSFGAALWLGNLATLAGSLAALVFAQALLGKFGGKGLVPAGVAAQPLFALTVVGAAALTVLVATRLGLPVSTTHALVGALVGGGLVASSEGVHWGALEGSFVNPLLVSPFLAIAAGAILFPAFRASAERLGLTGDACLCAAPGAVLPNAAGLSVEVGAPVLAAGRLEDCAPSDGAYVSAAGIRDGLHLLSGAAVSFARGLNDTPKIAALLLLAGGLGQRVSIPLVAVAMLVGGWLGARRVAETMAHRITRLDDNEAVCANLVTAGLVLGASAMGSPVSTTHVACGALFGIGGVSGQARWRTITGIIVAWVVTLPMAALFGLVGYRILGTWVGA